MATYPTASAVNGTKFFITTDEPATHDSAGFGAIVDSVLGDGSDGWVEAGCVVTGGIPGETRNYSDVTCWGGNSFKVIGSAVLDAVSYALILNPESAGQDLLESLKDGQNMVWVRIELPAKVNLTYYFAAYVSNVRPIMSGSDDAIQLGFDLVAVYDANGIGVVKTATTP